MSASPPTGSGKSRQKSSDRRNRVKGKLGHRRPGVGNQEQDEGTRNACGGGDCGGAGNCLCEPMDRRPRKRRSGNPARLARKSLQLSRPHPSTPYAIDGSPRATGRCRVISVQVNAAG